MQYIIKETRLSFARNRWSFCQSQGVDPFR